MTATRETLPIFASSFVAPANSRNRSRTGGHDDGENSSRHPGSWRSASPVMRPSVCPGARRAESEAAPLPPDSAYERMNRLRIDYMLAAGDPRRRFAINREFIALAFEMRTAGASRGHIMTMGQAPLFHARREVAELRALG